MLEPSVAASDISPDEALRSERLIPFMVASLEASLLPNEDSQRSALVIEPPESADDSSSVDCEPSLQELDSIGECCVSRSLKKRYGTTSMVLRDLCAEGLCAGESLRLRTDSPRASRAA